MTLRASARCCAGTFPARHREGEWNCSGRKANEYEYRCVWRCGPEASRNFPESLLSAFPGSAAVAALVLGCAWTVYSNVFGASIYPSVNSAAYRGAGREAQSSSIARTSPAPTFNDVFADLPDAGRRRSHAPRLVPHLRLCLTNGLQRSAPQSEAPGPRRRATQIAGSRQVEAPTSRDRQSSPSHRSRSRAASALRADRARDAGRPAPRRSQAGCEVAGASVRDMAQRAKAAVMSIARRQADDGREALGQGPSHGSLLAYASADVSASPAAREGTEPDARRFAAL